MIIKKKRRDKTKSNNKWFYAQMNAEIGSEENNRLVRDILASPTTFDKKRIVFEKLQLEKNTKCKM